MTDEVTRQESKHANSVRPLRRSVAVMAAVQERAKGFGTAAIPWIWRRAIALFRQSHEPPIAPSLLRETQARFENTRRIARAGYLTIFLFVLGFITWAALAPLDSAVLAPGVVVVEDHHKEIQHLEGGIVRSVLVSDGQVVKSGQLLVRLDDTQARSSLALLNGQHDALEAQEARLIAERDGRATITFPDDLVKRRSDPQVASAIQGEQKAFETRRETLSKQVEILTKRSEENASVIAGLKDQKAAVERQLSLIRKEEKSVQTLYKKGLSTLPRLLDLQRKAADLSGQRGQLIQKIAQTKVNSGENELQIMNLRNKRLDQVVKDLRDVQTKRFDLLDRIEAAKDVLARLMVRSPVAGKVVSLAVHTNGAVIHPGQIIMEIVPQSDGLQVEAHVRPQDANSVHVGMTARVNLSGYEQRRLPIIDGTVREVSADRIVDKRTGRAYFKVDVAVDRNELKPYPSARLIPGLPVEVELNTGRRTAFEYLSEPISDVFRKGMREK